MAAMWHSPEMAYQMIRDQAFTRMVAFDINGNDPIFRCEDREPEDVVTELERLLDFIPDAVRVECGKRGDYTDKGGKPGVGSVRKPMVWRFRGSGATRISEPIATPLQGAPSAPSGWIPPEVHALTLEVERLRMELAAKVNGAPEALPDEDEADEDEADEVDQAERIVTIIRGVRAAIPELFGAAKAETAINGAAPNVEAIAQDADLLAAVARMKAANPAEFDQYRQIILNSYGGKE